MDVILVMIKNLKDIVKSYLISYHNYPDWHYLLILKYSMKLMKLF